MDNYSTLGKQPISEAQPAGSDVRGEDNFDLLQNEIAKMSNPTTSGTLDWQQVVTLAAGLLGGKGKDILVGCYLTGGLLQTRGLPGLLDGLQVLSDMLETYWDTMYPPLARLRARRNALDWLLDRIRMHGEENDWSALPQQEIELVEGLRSRLQAIDAVLSEKDSEASSMRPALSQVGTIPVKEVPVEAPAASESASSGASPSSAVATSNSGTASMAAGPALSSAPPESTEGAEQAVGEALERLAALAAWYNETDLSKAQAYGLNRIAAWAGVDTLPPVRGAHTMLPAPVPQVADALRNLVRLQSNEDIVRFAEAQLPNFPFWLDLNCAAAQALERLGENYDAARREVSGHTALLLTRLPGVEQLAFNGGMPFADADTQQWLQGLAISGGGDAGGSAAKPAGKRDDVQAVFARASALAAENDLAGAAGWLQKAIDQNVAPAAKLQLRIHLCELLFTERPGANLDAFAHAIVADVDRFQLTTWDPPLALNGLQAAYNILARNDDDKPGADALLARIASLDAATAVKLVT